MRGQEVGIAEQGSEQQAAEEAPTCAQNATPPPSVGATAPLSSCSRNQYPSITKAGMTIIRAKIPRKTNVTTPARG